MESLKITTRRLPSFSSTHNYVDVKIACGSTQVDLGLADESEQRDLAVHLTEIVDDLTPDGELAALRALRARLEDDALAKSCNVHGMSPEQAISAYRAALREGI
jgi:hypothetical protein